jgi:hypothetical protein
MLNVKKLILVLCGIVSLNGCVQSSAMLGPAITLASTGNILQAGVQYGTNHAIKRETGKDALTHIAEAVEQDISEKKIKKDLVALLEKHIEESRKLIQIKNQ